MANLTPIQVPIAPGELIDKITILEIKCQRMEDVEKLANVRCELDLLRGVQDSMVSSDPTLTELSRALKSVNERIWDIEDAIRDLERKGDFGDKFVSIARSVYITNDERAALKRQINLHLGSQIVEEKSYHPY